MSPLDQVISRDTHWWLHTFEERRSTHVRRQVRSAEPHSCRSRTVAQEGGRVLFDRRIQMLCIALLTDHLHRPTPSASRNWKNRLSFPSGRCNKNIQWAYHSIPTRSPERNGLPLLLHCRFLGMSTGAHARPRA